MGKRMNWDRAAQRDRMRDNGTSHDDDQRPTDAQMRYLGLLVKQRGMVAVAAARRRTSAREPLTRASASRLIAALTRRA